MLSDKKPTYNISEIFYSIQGESTLAGMPCVFIRMQGCNIRCQWCDTDYALDVKQIESIKTTDEILKDISKYNCYLICVTGGEPLMQKNVDLLLTHLCDSGYQVSLETNGIYSLKNIDKRVKKIVDFKCPASQMDKTNNFDNIKYLTKNDEIKFVIADRNDYEWTKIIINRYNLNKITGDILLSAVFSSLDPADLSKWILEDALHVRMQLQLHKYIWNPNERGV